MMNRRDRAEREAWNFLNESLSGVAERKELHGVLGHAGSGVQSLFVGRIERHMLRAYCNGMARCFHGLALAALAASKGEASIVTSCLQKNGGRSGMGYPDWRLRASLLQRIWPLGREMQDLLNDYRLQGVRGKALSVAMASMALRLSPSLQRRLCLAQALHRQGTYHRADALMARIVSRPISPRDRALAWIQQSAFYRERGRLREAQAAARAAVTCAAEMPLAWASWLLASALVGELEDVQIAGRGLASVADSEHAQIRRFRRICAGAYGQQHLPGEWLKGMPEVAQRLLWETFS